MKTSSLLMICPKKLSLRRQLEADNLFGTTLTNKVIGFETKVTREIEQLTQILTDEGVNLIQLEVSNLDDLQELIFLKKAISFHQNGDVVFYPTKQFRLSEEYQNTILELIEREGFAIENSIDYSEAADQDCFLEGEASIVLDRTNEIAYCALSPCSAEEVFVEFCEDMDLAPVIFETRFLTNHAGISIPHTNKMLFVGKEFAVVCDEVITDKAERKQLLDSLKATNKAIIRITEQQMLDFTTQIVELYSRSGQQLLLMSERAKQSFSQQQLAKLQSFGKIVSCPLQATESFLGEGLSNFFSEIVLD